MTEPQSANPMPSRIFKSLNLLHDLAVLRQLGQLIFAISYFLKMDNINFPTLRSNPALVIGMPVCREMLRFILSMPNILFIEKLTPEIFMRGLNLNL